MEPPEHHHHQQPSSINLLTQLSDIISNSFISLFTPYTSKSSTTFGDGAAMSPTAMSPTVDRTTLLLKRAVMGFIGAAYVGLVLFSLMLFSFILGVCFVRFWVEEPVRIEENLYFDFTDVHPSAVLEFGFVKYDKVVKRVPVGHVSNARLVVVMPESDYNREIGMFQVVAESLTSNGDVITSSSHPCMLRFHSPPIRAMQTFLLTAPLVFGFKHEIQILNIPVLKYKEHHYPRTQTIKISLIPRAGIPLLPQLYEARLVINSQLPFAKELVRNWKYTFYVWTSFYIYLLLLVVLVSRFRSLVFPTNDRRLVGSDVFEETIDETREVVGERDEPSPDILNRWREIRRKGAVLGRGSDETSISVTRDDDASVSNEEVGDSESICA